MGEADLQNSGYPEPGIFISAGRRSGWSHRPTSRIRGPPREMPWNMYKTATELALHFSLEADIFSRFPHHCELVPWLPRRSN